ncbi:protein of unknown function DUF181 [Methylobacterium sp. 4-46]|uniref:TOMM precursor leader peptide-binding protein n=1 Tax=unclassified Methylobacterium TaxID=2615210 RepID=UPI000152BFD5|nr:MULTISPECIES: TOMM precursor leader peptide-binding protein [Methylobacterium]ACA18333.1 protein of unknown function DUF181 [Methylobacterium sp. 4-46]WFT77631.1 TOMM precursor leader peptide-binding protein [Methylobacterium nodulans]
MTADRGGAAIRRDGREIPRFAPNFSVYVLPPNVVCLYSEHRKFFLEGDLYAALAPQLAAGRTLKAIFDALTLDFPAQAITEALRRLVERRFVLLDRVAADDAAAAFWASLGLPPGAAEWNLRNCRVRIRALDVSGADDLAAALTGLGVRVVKRTADLTVVLVNDYLDARLAETNRRHLSDETPWLIVQPSGIFPLVGPLLAPGKGACWTCLADRMRWNREVKAFLERQRADPVALSPLVRNPVGQSATPFAAIEIAKAIATDFRTDLRDHVISFDLTGATIARHFVAARPQCPACGHPEQRDPNRPANPLELKAGGKLVLTSGGYRALSPEATLARYRKHVSPLTGVVSRLEPMEADLSLNTSYVARHNFSPRPETVPALKAGLGSDSYGKGSTSEQAQASALMEAIERYSGIFQGDEIRVVRRFDEFGAGEAIAPNDVMLFSDAQYRQGLTGAHDHESFIPAPFDPSAAIAWSPVWSLRDAAFKYLPTSFLYYFCRGSGHAETSADSNGCAAGNTIEEAIVQGFLELVERDAYAIWWYNRLQRPPLDLDALDDSYIRDLRAQLTEAGRRLWVLDITNDLGIPSFVAISHWTENGEECVEFGSGSHFDTRIAALRAITELNQFFSIGLMARRHSVDPGDDSAHRWRLDNNPYFVPDGQPRLPPDFRSGFARLDRRDQVLACVDLMASRGLEFLVLDQTRPDIGVPVVKVIVPGMRHFYPRFGPGRLYDVPLALGWLDRSVPERDLNPLFPPT